MTQHDPLVSMRHMRDHAQEAIDLLGKMTQDQLSEDRTIQLAISRLIEIIGEAANRVPDDFRQQHPNLPWRQAIGMRHLLAHGYDVIEYAVIWDTVNKSLPPFVRQLNAIIGPPGDDDSLSA